MVKLGVIGAGNIAATHLKVLPGLPNVEIVGVADIVRDRAESVARGCGAKAWYTDYRELIDKEAPEAIYVLTPPFLHQEQVCYAVERGIHVFVEKPLEVSLSRAKKILGAVRRESVTTQVGYHWRFMDGIRKAREILLSMGGPIGLLEARWWGGVYMAPWWIKVDQSGGQIVEQATHVYDQVRWLGGDASQVYCVLGTLLNKDIPGFTIEDVAIVTLNLKSGAFATVSSTNAAIAPEVWVKAIAKNVKYEADWTRATLYWKDRLETYYNRANAYEEENRAFIEAIQKDIGSPVPIEEGYKSLELSLAALESVKKGRPVTLPL